MVVIDTDVLVVEFFFQHDRRYQDSHRFLSTSTDDLAITVYNLLEILGQASFHLPSEELSLWPDWLCQPYKLNIIWPKAPPTIHSQDALKEVIFDWPFAKMAHGRFHYKDAAIYDLAENAPNTLAFVTWNTKHFLGKGRVPAYTPQEFLKL